MSNGPKPTPNTRLGEVNWWCDEFFGTMLFVCQGLLGMGERKTDERFLNSQRWSFADLLDYLDERELRNGMLAFDVYADNAWHTCILATIETTIPYTEYEDGIVDEQTLLNLIEDFKDHVRSLPLCDADKREGAIWTDEDIERGYSKAVAKLHKDAWRQIDEVYTRVLEDMTKKTDEEGGSQ